MKRVVLFSVIVVLLVSSYSYADSDKLIQEVLEKSGAQRQISEIPKTARALISIQLATYGAKENTEVVAFAGRVIDNFFIAAFWQLMD